METPFSQSPFAAILIVTAMLTAVLAAGVFAIVSAVAARLSAVGHGPGTGQMPGRPRLSDRPGSPGPSGLPDRGDWEGTLATYKNLRDEGVLSEEEFRKIRTLAGPPRLIGTPDLRAQHRSPTDPARPEHERM